MRLRSIIFALGALLAAISAGEAQTPVTAICVPANPGCTPVTASNPFPTSATFGNISSSVTRAANTTTYTANTAVCGSATVVCSINGGGILTFAMPASSGIVAKFELLKSSSTTTNATFNVFLFTALPTVSTTVKDNAAYVGPFAADLPNYVGEATCNGPLATNDGTAQTRYDCLLSNPNISGALPWSGSSTLYGLTEVTAAYAPASAEVFTALVGGFTP